jgi:proline iminopeptidase
MPLIETQVGPLSYEEVGQGKPLLIAHGGPGLHHGLYRTLDPLGATRRLVYWDHHGHGRSGPLPAGPLGMELFADDAIRLADDLGLNSFAVLGHSFGGWVAQEIALRHPERVSALVLAATTPGQIGATESADDDQGPPPPAEVIDLMSRRPTTAVQLSQVYAALAPHYLRTADPGPFLAALQPELLSPESMVRVFDALASWSSVDRLHQVRCPTLVLAGQHDVFCSPPQLVRIASRIPDARHVLFQASGHFMWLEEPDLFFGLVSEWLSSD